MRLIQNGLARWKLTDAKVITFEKGLIGFEDCTRFAIVYETENEKDNKIMWAAVFRRTALALPLLSRKIIVR